MAKLISGAELRDRLLSKAKRNTTDSWVQVLAVPGNRDLLGLIARKQPRSIGGLAELAGRAQPNVSRSMSALTHAGLIGVRQEGRASIPFLTPLGREKAQELRLLDSPMASAPSAELPASLPLLSILVDDGVAADSAALPGKVIANLPIAGYDDPVAATMSADLNAIALTLLESWWRLLYRRDAPTKIGTFALEGGDAETRASLAVRSLGRRVELMLRRLDRTPLQLEQTAKTVPLGDFERCLLDGILRSVDRELRTLGRFDEPPQAKLRRLEDSLGHPNDVQFCRTAGALGVSPYSTTPETAAQVRHLMETLPDEDARLDFASAVLPGESDKILAWASSEIGARAGTNGLPRLDELRTAHGWKPIGGMRPWRLGTTVARAARSALGLPIDASVGGTRGMARLFGASTGFEASPNSPAVIRGLQGRYRDVPTVVVEEAGPEATTFVLGRAIGDYLVFASISAYVTDRYTDRQAVGRAFSAEFIAPAEGVVRMVEDEEQAREKIAAHYGASLETVNWQYDNNYFLYR